MKNQFVVCVVGLCVSLFATASELDGSWLGPCEAVTQGYARGNFTFTGNKFQLEVLHYPTAKCEGANIRIENNGTYSSAAPSIDYIAGASFMTPLNAGTAITMNLLGLCGIRNWKANQAQEISGKVCDGKQVPNFNDPRYGIYSREDDTLYLGKETEEENGLTPETRPTEIDRNRPFELLF